MDNDHQITLLQNELDSKNHFIELLRDQVAELKLVIENKNDQITDSQKQYSEQNIKMKHLVVGHNYYLNLNNELKEKYTEDLNKLTATLIQQSEQLDFRNKQVENRDLCIARLEKDCVAYVDRIKELKDTPKYTRFYDFAVESIPKINNEKLMYKQVSITLYKFIQYLSQIIDSRKIIDDKVINQLLEDKRRLLEYFTKEKMALKLVEYKEIIDTKDNRIKDLNFTQQQLLGRIKILRDKLIIANELISKLQASKILGFKNNIDIQELSQQWLNFDSQPENQISAFLDEFPSIAQLNQQIEQLENKNQELQQRLDHEVELSTINIGALNDLVKVNKELREKLSYNDSELQRLDSLVLKDNTDIAELRHSVHDKDYIIEKQNNLIETKDKEIKELKHLLNREQLRREDLQTANFNFIAKEKLLKKKLGLAHKVINWLPLNGLSKEIRQDINDFMNFDDNAENQIDNILESFPNVTSLTALQRQLEITQEENERLKTSLSVFTIFFPDCIEQARLILDDNKEFRGRILYLEDSNEDLIKGNQEYLETIEELTKTLAEWRQKYNLEIVRSNDLVSINSNLKIKIEDSKKDWDSISKRNQELKEINASLTNDLCKVQTQRDSLVSRNVLLEKFYNFIDSEEKLGHIANINYDIFYPLLDELRSKFNG